MSSQKENDYDVINSECFEAHEKLRDIVSKKYAKMIEFMNEYDKELAKLKHEETQVKKEYDQFRKEFEIEDINDPAFNQKCNKYFTEFEDYLQRGIDIKREHIEILKKYEMLF